MQTEGTMPLTTIGQVVRALIDESDTRRVHESLVHGALSLTGMAGALTATRHPATGDLTIEAQHGLAVLEGGALPAVVRRALEERRILVADDARLPVPDGESLRTLTALPVMREGRALAVLVVGHAPGHRRLSADDLAVLEILMAAGAVTLALGTTAADGARRLATVEEHAQSLRRVTTAQRTDAVIERALDGATTLFGADRAALYRADEAGGITYICARRLSRKYLHAVLDTYRTGLGGVLLRTTAPMVIPDMVTDPRSRKLHDAAREEGIHTAALLPFITGNRAAGALCLYHDIPWHYPEADVALARAFADQVAASLQEADQRDRLGRRAHLLEIGALLIRTLAQTGDGDDRVRAGLSAMVMAGLPCVWLFRQTVAGELVVAAQAGASPLDPRLPAEAARGALRSSSTIEHATGGQRLVAATLPNLTTRWALVFSAPRRRVPEPRPVTVVIEIAPDEPGPELIELGQTAAAALAIALSLAPEELVSSSRSRAATTPP
jgi:GAF domain-containing protein